MEWSRDVQAALGSPFPEDEIEFLPRAVSGNRALAIAHIEARSVMRRLDAVVGADGWEFDFDALAPDCKKIKGRLTVLGVTKCDAGEAGAEDEPLKAAVSDALKRCGVHFGIGRYLYYVEPVWWDYDPQRKRFAERPRLPGQAVEAALAICGHGGPAPARDPVPERKERIRAAAQASPANRSPVGGIKGRPELHVEQGGAPATTADGHAVDPATGELKTDDAEARAADVALLQSFADAGLDPKLPGLMRAIAQAALKRDVPVFRNLGPGPRREVAAWLDTNRMEGQGICTDVQAGLAQGQKAG